MCTNYTLHACINLKKVDVFVYKHIKMNKIKNIAITAFESKKTDLIEWSYFNRNYLFPHNITALGFAENILEGTLNKKIQPVSGYHELCALISNNKIDALIIFGEAEKILESKDIHAVLQAAVEHNIVVTLNNTTADFILHSSLIDEAYIASKKEKKSARAFRY